MIPLSPRSICRTSRTIRALPSLASLSQAVSTRHRTVNISRVVVVILRFVLGGVDGSGDVTIVL